MNKDKVSQTIPLTINNEQKSNDDENINFSMKRLK